MPSQAMSSYDKIFLLSPLLLHFCDYVIGSGKGCPDPAIPQSRSFHGNPASRTYVIAILNIVFFPNPVSVPKFRRIPLCGWQSNPYPFNVSRIPHCLLVKFRDPGYTLHVRCQFNSFFFVFSWFRKSERTPVMGREWVNIYFFSYCCLGRLGWSMIETMLILLWWPVCHIEWFHLGDCSHPKRLEKLHHCWLSWSVKHILW